MPPYLIAILLLVEIVHGQYSLEEARLTAPDAATGDLFGVSIAIDADTLVVGAIFDDGPAGANQGSAHVFALTGGTWIHQIQLMAADAAAGASFGKSVAIDDDTLVVGASQAGGTGAAYVFVRDPETPETWTQQAKLTASDGGAGENFGVSVGISGDTAIVGSYQHEGPAGPGQGAAYIFVRNGMNWSEQAELLASDAAADDLFGSAVAIDGETVAVGARANNGEAPGANNEGAAYAFVRTGTVWSEQTRFAAADAAPGDHLGFSIGISGDTIVAGAMNDAGPAGTGQGSAYVIARNGTLWSQQGKLTASDGALGDNFGWSVSISGDTVTVGSIGDDRLGAFDQGAAYVFGRNEGVWTESHKLTASDAGQQDNLGFFVGVKHDAVAVGAYRHDGVGGENQGGAYVFRLLPCCRGDLDASGTVGATDIEPFVQVLLDESITSSELCAADVNEDGFQDGADAQPLIDKLLGGGACP